MNTVRTENQEAQEKSEDQLLQQSKPSPAPPLQTTPPDTSVHFVVKGKPRTLCGKLRNGVQRATKNPESTTCQACRQALVELGDMRASAEPEKLDMADAAEQILSEVDKREEKLWAYREQQIKLLERIEQQLNFIYQVARDILDIKILEA